MRKGWYRHVTSQLRSLFHVFAHVQLLELIVDICGQGEVQRTFCPLMIKWSPFELDFKQAALH
jgi:hypothetical protein